MFWVVFDWIFKHVISQPNLSYFVLRLLQSWLIYFINWIYLSATLSDYCLCCRMNISIFLLIKVYIAYKLNHGNCLLWFNLKDDFLIYGFVLNHISEKLLCFKLLLWPCFLVCISRSESSNKFRRTCTFISTFRQVFGDCKFIM